MFYLTNIINRNVVQNIAIKSSINNKEDRTFKLKINKNDYTKRFYYSNSTYVSLDD